MCIIIHKPKGVTLKDEVYERCMKHHSDGAGLAYVKDGKFKAWKGYFKIKELLKDIKEAGDQDMIIHFRNASPGMTISTDQCHPFIIVPRQDWWNYESEEDGKKVNRPRYKIAVFHNGRLDYPFDADHSDTNNFVNEILKPLFDRDPEFLDEAFARFMLGRTIASTGFTSNKMAIMVHDFAMGETKIHIINEKLWTVEHGCMFSNDTFKQPIYTSYSSNVRGDDAWWIKYKGKELTNMMQFERPNEWGWCWSHRYKCWRNIKTGITCARLKNRPIRPVYMDSDISLAYDNEMDGDAGPKLTKEEMITYCRNPWNITLAGVYLTEREPVNWDPERDCTQYKLPLNVGPTVEKTKVGNIVVFEPKNETNSKGTTTSVSTGVVPSFKHLTKAEEKTFRSVASEYCRDEASGFKDYRMNSNEMVELFRADLRGHIFELNGADDSEIDLWVLNKYAKSNDVVGIILNEIIRQQEKEGEEAIRERKGIAEGGPTEDDVGVLSGDRINVPRDEDVIAGKLEHPGD